MAFNWAGRNQSPFSPSSSPSWGSDGAARSTFGIGPSSTPFGATTTGSLFASSPGFGAPSTGGAFSSGVFFGQQSSSGIFSQQQSSPSLFAPTAFRPSAPAAPQTTHGQPWNMGPVQHTPINPFRDEFYRVVKRKDGRPVTYHTRLDELEEAGQRAIRMIQYPHLPPYLARGSVFRNEQEQYKKIVAEIKSDPFFHSDANLDSLQKEFRDALVKLREDMAGHRLEVDAALERLRAFQPKADSIDRAVREAEYLLNELDKTGQARGEGRLYVADTTYQHRLEQPHPFITQKAMELPSRVRYLKRQVSEMESIQGAMVNGGSGSEEMLQAVQLMNRISSGLKEKISHLSKEVAYKKELFMAERRREGEGKDPFEGTIREQRILDEEMHDDWQRSQIRLLQPYPASSVAVSAPPPLPFGQTPPASSPLVVGFGQSGLFGQTSGGSFFPASTTSPGSPFSAPAFASAPTQPSTIFGSASPQTTTGSLFGSGAAAATTGSSFGFFGASSSPGTSPIFGQSGFRNSAAGAVSPGSSVATNLGTSPVRPGSKNTSTHHSL